MDYRQKILDRITATMAGGDRQGAIRIFFKNRIISFEAFEKALDQGRRKRLANA